MAATLPVLPNIPEAQKAKFQEKTAALAFELLEDYAQLIRASDDPKDKLAGLTWATKASGLERTPGSSADLPLFNIVFHLGEGQSGTVTVNAPDKDSGVIDIESTPVLDAPAAPETLEAGSPGEPVPEEVSIVAEDDLMAALDKMILE